MSEPVHISEILPEVMSNIAERMNHDRRHSPAGVLQPVEDCDMPSGCAQQVGCDEIAPMVLFQTTRSLL
ncbi:MAG: hypothetical protein ABIF19_06065 [Planctomycetota bacterium]